MTIAWARAAQACVSVGCDGAGGVWPVICARRPAGTTTSPPSTTGGRAEICASRSNCSIRFWSRACSSSARRRASCELRPGIGPTSLLLELEFLGAVVPVTDLLGEAVLDRGAGLVDPPQTPPPDLLEVLRHYLPDGVRDCFLLQVACDPGARGMR